MSNNQELLNKLIGLLETHKHGVILNILKRMIKKSRIVLGNMPEVYDIIGELTKKDPNFFMVKIYPRLYKFLVKRHNKNYIKWWENRDINNIDWYILGKYCLYEGEKIILRFLGHISPYDMSGLVYLTNYRIILNGIKPLPIAFSYAQLLINASIRAIGRGMRSKIAKHIRKEISEVNVGEWGYPVPLFNAFDIRNDNKKITFIIKTEKKNIQFKIRPEKKHKEDILSQIENLLLEYQ